MLFLLLLIHSLAANALPVSRPGASYKSQNPSLDGYRTLWDILFSCASTVVLCTWAAIRPNIPEPVDGEKVGLWKTLKRKLAFFYRDRLPIVIMAALFPEYILFKAISQRLMANKLVEDNANLKLTKSHGFFIVMGGYHYFKVVDQTEISKLQSFDKTSKGDEALKREEVPVHPVFWKDAISMIKEHQIPLPNYEEIRATRRRDWLFSALAFMRATWFGMQWLARLMSNLPPTQLENMALAYTAIDIGILLAWREKPSNVTRPIRVFQKPLELDNLRVKELDEKSPEAEEGRDRAYLHSRRKIPVFYPTGKSWPDDIALESLIITTILLGEIFFLIGLGTDSPSYDMRPFWWTLSAVIVIPFSLVAASGFIGMACGDFWGTQLLCSLAAVLYGLSSLVYIAFRIVAPFLVISSMNSLPPSTFQSVHWTSVFDSLW